MNWNPWASNVCHEEAVEAVLHPEREKAGLLLQRPVADGFVMSGSGWCPADVWLPRGESGKGEALDFVISSGLQSELFLPADLAPGLVFQRYDMFKRSYQDIAGPGIPIHPDGPGGVWGSLESDSTELYRLDCQAASFNHQ
jgi:hypothetical protein